MGVRTGLVRRLAFILLSGTLLGTTAMASPDPTLWLKLQQSKWVSQGTQDPRHGIYVVMDANCPYCHDLWSTIRTRYSKGLQVRYVMVGFISPTSPGKAAAILEATNPSQALDQNEMYWGRLPDDLGGGIPPKSEMQMSTLTALMQNEQLIRRFGVMGTPALIYRDKGGNPHVVQAVPSEKELDAIVADATSN